ncbi:hypothetical protein ACFQXA_31035 [Nocardiopsis composta]
MLGYRQHVQGRRRRFKARTRGYLDSGTASFEVKMEGARSATVKERTAHPVDRLDEFTPRRATSSPPCCTGSTASNRPATCGPQR